MGSQDGSQGAGAYEGSGPDTGGIQLPRTDSLIPRLTEVPETPEERTRRRTIRVVTVVAIVVAITTAALITLALIHAARVEDAALQASMDGRQGSYQAALQVLEDDDDAESLLLRARLHAARALEFLSDEDAKRAAELLANVTDEDRKSVEGHVAATYLALHRGDLDTAVKEASAVGAEGAYAAEHAHAMAVTARSVGDLKAGAANIAIAMQQQPGSSRHAALAGLLAGRASGVDAAAKILDAVNQGAESPAVRTARARVWHQGGAEAKQIQAELNAVLGPLKERASTSELAWAHLLMVAQAVQRGESDAAVRELVEATKAPIRDEAFGLLRIDVLLALDRLKDAADVYASLPKSASSDLGYRAQLGATIAIEQGQVDLADTELKQAPAGPRTALLRARLLQARSSFDNARAAYQQAAQAPQYFVEAQNRLAMMELGRKRASAALEATERVLVAHPAHRAAVPIAVDALLMQGKQDEASALVASALKTYPGSSDLLFARARVELQLAQWGAARATLKQALSRKGDDPALFAHLGEAERELGQTQQASKAYEAALKLDANQPVALTGMLLLSVDLAQLDKAAEWAERISSAKLASIEVERARARFFVLQGAGQAGVRALRQAAARNREDRDLWTSLGYLYLQSENYGSAANCFARVLRLHNSDVQALLGRALVQLRLGRRQPAETSLLDIEKLGRVADLPPMQQAEMQAIRARLKLAEKRLAPARRLARRALAVDAKNSEAHFVQADVASVRSQDSTGALRAAVNGRRPPNDARARLVLALEENTPERCGLTEAYLRAAPLGRFAEPLRRVRWRCRD